MSSPYRENRTEGIKTRILMDRENNSSSEIITRGEKAFQWALKRRGPEDCRDEQLMVREAHKALRVAVRKSQEKF